MFPFQCPIPGTGVKTKKTLYLFPFSLPAIKGMLYLKQKWNASFSRSQSSPLQSKRMRFVPARPSWVLDSSQEFSGSYVTPSFFSLPRPLLSLEKWECRVSFQAVFFTPQHGRLIDLEFGQLLTLPFPFLFLFISPLFYVCACPIFSIRTWVISFPFLYLRAYHDISLICNMCK